MHCPLIVSLACCAASCCLVAPVGYPIIIFCHPLVTPPSCPLIMLAGCCVASPCVALWLLHCLLSSSHFAALSSSCHASWFLHCLSLSSRCATSRQLVMPAFVASPLLVLLLRPAPPSCPIVAPAGCYVSSQGATLSSSCRLVVLPLDVMSPQLVDAPSSFIALSLHHPLVLSSFHRCCQILMLTVTTRHH
jgi:hypothetical protein